MSNITNIRPNTTLTRRLAAEVQASFDTSSMSDILTQLNKYKEDSQFGLTFMVKYAVRRSMPYGKWTCENGREVIFNREYQPIFERHDGIVTHARRNEWVEDIHSVEMYYDDLTSPLRLLEVSVDRPTGQSLRACRKALVICLTVLKEFAPVAHVSENRQWSTEQLTPQ